MNYSLLRRIVPEDRRAAVARNLLRISQRLDAAVPTKDANHNLLLATWNIRDFGKRKNRGFGPRLPESLFYIAEYLSRFDFVAAQEVNELYDLETVLAILGPDWDFIATDVTDTKLGGNGERLTYLFDRRKVRFQNIAGEIVLPNDLLISRALVPAADTDEQDLYAGKQFRRTPFTAKFQSNWFRFEICTVHLYYGEESGAKLRERIQEIDRVARYFGQRSAEAEKEFRSLILLGDFNIVHKEHETMSALTDHGFKVPDNLGPSNVAGGKYYDQIAFKAKSRVLEYVNTPAETRANSGVIDIFEDVFTASDFEVYRAAVAASPTGSKKDEAALRRYYSQWRTYQLSDHNIMWVRLCSNDSARYLSAVAAGQKEWS